jgi:uncharacterized membrane protein YdjX (TVP38/TMEM64 family)
MIDIMASLIIVSVLPILFLLVNLYTYIFTDPDAMRDFRDTIGSNSPIIFILLQVTQAIFAPFPDQVTGLADRYFKGP